MQSGMLRPLCDAVYRVPHNCNVVQRVVVLSSVTQHRTSKPKREIREPATFAGLNAFAMRHLGCLGVSSSEDEAASQTRVGCFGRAWRPQHGRHRLGKMQRCRRTELCPMRRTVWSRLLPKRPSLKEGSWRISTGMGCP